MVHTIIIYNLSFGFCGHALLELICLIGINTVKGKVLVQTHRLDSKIHDLT